MVLENNPVEIAEIPNTRFVSRRIRRSYCIGKGGASSNACEG